MTAIPSRAERNHDGRGIVGPGGTNGTCRRVGILDCPPWRKVDPRRLLRGSSSSLRARVPFAQLRKGLGKPRVGWTVNALVHWHCVAIGRVQGVNYRARVAEAARRRGVVGSVANQPDGTVFIDVQGPLEVVEAFLREVSGRRGLSHAHTVERVADVPVDVSLVDFEIQRD